MTKLIPTTPTIPTTPKTPAHSHARQPGRADGDRTRLPLRQCGHPAERARHHARDTLAGWDCPADTVQDAQLIVGELVANAAEHGGGAVELTLTLDRTRRRVVIAVRDADPHLPHPHQDQDDGMEESGRGLDIVQALADLYGCAVDADGKVIWATVAAPMERALPGVAVLANHLWDLLV